MSNKIFILFPFLGSESPYSGKILNKNLSKYSLNNLDFQQRITLLNFQLNKNAVKDYSSSLILYFDFFKT